jgi:hypothetical protein
VQGLFTGARNFSPPVDSAAGTVETDGEELAVIDGGEENPVSDQDRRGMPGRQLRLPNDILVGAKFNGKILIVRYARRVGTSKLQPVLTTQKKGASQQGDYKGNKFFH